MTTSVKPKKEFKLNIPVESFNEMIDWAIELIQSMPTKHVEEDLADWMERKFVLPKGESNMPGLFSFRKTPYLREIASNLSFNSEIIKTAVMKTNQLGFTIVALALICYCVDYGIGPGIYANGDALMAEETFEKRLDTILAASGLQDKIKAVVKKAHDKTTGDRRESKSYGGTAFRAVGPNSESKLRSSPIRIAIKEETDVFPQLLKGKGNPIEKIDRRLDSFGPYRKDYENSTPKEKITSQIEPSVDKGDVRLYHVPCPACGHKQPLVWSGLKWDKKEDGSIDIEIDDDGKIVKDPVYYECAACKAHWKESDKYFFLRDAKAGGMDLPDGRHVYAEWIPTKKPEQPNMRSYKINALYSPFRTWLDIAIKWYQVKEDPVKFPDFVNDTWGETFEQKLKTPKPHFLMERAEPWECGHVPKGVLRITLAADIQADRIEAGIVGWGKDKENWMLDYWVFEGTTEDRNAPCWKALEEKITKQYVRCDGYIIGSPTVSMIDAGYLQDQVNHFCEQFYYSHQVVDGVYPCIGKENLREVWTAHPNDIETPLIHINDQLLKRTIYSYLNREAPTTEAALPMGYTHFPKTFGLEWYKQLLAEEIVIETDKYGRTKAVVTNAKQRRNEVLDVVKMNWAALYFAYERFFEILNKKRKLQKRREIEKDWSAFWGLWGTETEAGGDPGTTRDHPHATP